MEKNAVKLNLPTHIRTHTTVHVSLTKPVFEKPAKLREDIQQRSERLELNEKVKDLFCRGKDIIPTKKSERFSVTLIIERNSHT